MKLTDQALAKRGILSVINAIRISRTIQYVVIDKHLLQKLRKMKIGWDDTSPRAYHQLWLDGLKQKDRINIPICIKLKGFGKIKEAQLHNFFDANDIGYGEC